MHCSSGELLDWVREPVQISACGTAGNIAHQVQRDGEEWLGRIAKLEQMTYSAEKEARTKEWQQELNKAELSSPRALEYTL